MKRTIAVFFLVLLLCGCGNKKEADVKEVLSGGFSAQFSYSLEGIEFCGKLEKGLSGEYALTLSAPKSMENVIFYYVGGKTEISFDGITRYEAETGLGENSAVMLLCKTVENALLSNAVSGKIGSAEYSLSIENGKLSEITYNGIVIKVSNFVKT